MASTNFDPSKIWDDESGEPYTMTIEEFDARLEASNRRLEKENEEAMVRLREMEELVAQKEVVLTRLEAAVDEARRESTRINSRVAVLKQASRRARRKIAVTMTPRTPNASSL